RPPYAVAGYAWQTGPDISMDTLPDESQRNHLACTPLIVSGKAVDKLAYDPGQGGKRGRSAIGIKDGRLALYCTRDGGSMERTPEALRDDLAAAGWDSAVMLDGGGSSQCYFAGQTVTSSRAVHDLILVYLKGKKEENPMSGKKTVCLDAGHDAGNLANRSLDGTYYEHEFTLDMAKRIRAHLERCGVAVTETRPDGKAVSLAERCKIANGIQGLDLFVSLHSNAAGGSGWSSARGWSCYLYGAGGEREKAAQAILEQVRAAGVTVRTTALVYDSALYVLKHTVASAVLIEHAFHTNQEDTANLKSEAWRAKVAQAEAQGIAEYLGVPWVAEEAQESQGDVELSAAVEKLVAAGIIDSPDYWAAGKYSAATVRLLLIKMAAALG
ncbi:MAG: N-acetylmuramoyl-L-alanine amidase, partial [Oscillospiraceae bacterium]|nr:N-acetylmuramoyl-L-alanine amidase [Oscillospiraceae bacterium]